MSAPDFSAFSCPVPGCDRWPELKGMCATHYNYWNKHGRLPVRAFPHRNSRHARPPNTTVTIEGDHHIIQTTPRKAEAILMVLSGATLQEVGDHLGITRERVRQYMKGAGFGATPTVRLRQRDHSARMAKFARGGRHGQRKRQKAVTRERVVRAVEWIRWYVAGNGEAPTHHQLYHALTGKSREPALPFLQAYLRSYQKHKRGARLVRLVYKWAGTETRHTGTLGHMDKTSVGRHKRAWWHNLTPEKRAAEVARLSRQLTKARALRKSSP